MIQQAMAASLLLATGGKKSVSQPRPATRTKPAVIPPTVSTDVSAAVGGACCVSCNLVFPSCAAWLPFRLSWHCSTGPTRICGNCG
jgi:hypothetical protein